MSYIKHIITLAASTALTLFMSACSDDVDMPSPDVNPGDGYITISLSNARAGSRAGTEADVDALNENKIESVILALYPSANPSDKPVYLQTFDFTDTNTSTTLKVRLTNEIRDRLFPDGQGTSCSAFVIVNKPESSSEITDDMTISDMQKIAVSADFANRQGQNSFVMDGSTANITYRKQGTREWAEGSIEVRRVASKISLAVKVAESVEDNGVTWTPDVDRIKVLIRNGVNNSTLSPADFTPGAADYYSTSLSDSNEDYRERTFSNEGGDYPYALTSPFYTFPNRWDTADADNMTYMTLIVPWKKEGSSTYDMCYYTVPVTKDNSIGRNISYSVKINVNMLGSFTPDDPFELEDLSYYAVEWGSVGIDVDINDIRYLVVDQNAFTMNNEQLLNIPVYTSHPVTVKSVVLKYYRYNTTAQGKEREITITPTQETATENNNGGKGIYTCTFNTKPDGSTYVAYDHPLKLWTPYNRNGDVSLTGYASETAATTAINSITYYEPTTQDAFSRYIAEVTIVHTDKIEEPDEDLYTETLTITQYPQIYITSTENFYYYQSSGSVSPTYGNMYCNGNNTTNDEVWYTACGLYTHSANTNSNSNQYVIHITQFNDKADYIIGDPRMDQYTTLYGWKTDEEWVSGYWNGSSWVAGHYETKYFGQDGEVSPNWNWKDAPAIYDNPTPNGRGLKYYYRSDSSTTKARWIAPAFRIASSYGVCYDVSYKEAQARCASYQELGFPAGRWRIPTVAEIEYIIKLSNDNKIPTLFNSGSTYMSAQGSITATIGTDGKLKNPTNVTDKAKAVRCVYDEWYWNDVLTPSGTQNGPTGSNVTDIPKYTFTWGDRPR